MAKSDLEKTVSIVFKGVDDLSGTLNTLSRSVDTFAGDIESATQPLSDMADKVLKVEAALSAMALGGLAVAVKEAGSFGDSFNEISTLIDASTQDFDGFRRAILDYATTSTASIEDVNQAIYAAISAGLDYRDSVEFIATAEKLSVAGRADLESTTKTLVSTLNAYGEATDQAGRYADVFFETVKLGQTTLPELSASLSQVTAIAASAGVPIETVAAAIAALTAQGAPTSEAITRIKSAIVAIIKPSDQAKKAAEELGVEFSVSAVKSKGFETVLNEIYRATGGNAEEMAKFFGRVEGLNAALVLGADKGGKFAGALSEMKNAAGAVDDAFEKMSDNLGLVMRNLVNNLKATLIDIGTPLIDETTDIARGISDVFAGIRIGMDEGAFDPVFAALEAFGEKIAGDLRRIADAMPEALEQVDFDGLTAAFENLGGAVGDTFAALFGDIDLTTPEGLAAAIQKVVDAVTALTNVSSGIVSAWEPFAEWLGKAIDAFAEADDTTHSWIGNLLGLGQAINATSGLLSGFASGLSSVASALTAIGAIKYLGISSGIGSIASALGPFAIGGAIAVGIGYTAAKIMDSLIPAVEAIPPEVPLTLTLDDGNVLELATGIVRDIEGNVVSIPVDAEVAGRVKDDTSEVIKEMLLSGASDAQLNYVMNPSVENLEAALRDLGVEVKKQVETSIEPLEGLHYELKPLELIDVDQFKEDIDVIRVEADKIKTAVEWTAKLDIAKVEAEAKKMEAMFESINTTIESTGELLGDLYGTYTNKDLSIAEKWEIEEAIEREQERRDKALDLQEKMTEAQVELTEAKIKALEKGEALIKVEAPGLQPHLEAFMWEILETIQIRASEEGAEFLLGI